MNFLAPGAAAALRRLPAGHELGIQAGAPCPRRDGRRGTVDARRAVGQRVARPSRAPGSELVARVAAEAGQRVGRRVRVSALRRSTPTSSTRETGSAPALDVRHRRQLALMLAPYLLGLVALVGLPALVTFGARPDRVRPDPLAARSSGSTTFASCGRRDLPHRSPQLRGLRGDRGAAPAGWPRSGWRCSSTSASGAPAAAASAAILPTVVPDIAYGLLWLWLLNPLYGPIKLFLGWRAARADDLGAAAAAVADAPERRAGGDHHHEPVHDRRGVRPPARRRGSRSPASSTSSRRSRTRRRGTSSGASRFPCSRRSWSCCSLRDTIFSLQLTLRAGARRHRRRPPALLDDLPAALRLPERASSTSATATPPLRRSRCSS